MLLSALWCAALCDVTFLVLCYLLWLVIWRVWIRSQSGVCGMSRVTELLSAPERPGWDACALSCTPNSGSIKACAAGTLAQRSDACSDRSGTVGHSAATSPGHEQQRSRNQAASERDQET